MEINPTLYNSTNMKNQNIHNMNLFFYDNKTLFCFVFCKTFYRAMLERDFKIYSSENI